MLKFTPFARASIRSDGLTLCPIHPAMLRTATAVAAAHTARLRGVAVCDFHEEVEPGNNRLFVEAVGGVLSPAHRLTLVRFASDVGYHELWLDDRGDHVCVSLQGGVPIGQTARVTCPSCAHRMEHSSDDFWVAVNERRRFPDLCLLCGCLLPQWTVDPPEPIGPEEGELRAEENGRAASRWSAETDHDSRLEALMTMPVEDLTFDELHERRLLLDDPDSTDLEPPFGGTDR